MKTLLNLGALVLALTTFNFQLSTAFAQGSLTPPGAPAAGMKTLDQIYSRTDPRTPITNNASAVTISQPGSYYLTTNLTVSSGFGISITTNNVDLDLRGFTISSTSSSPSGIGIRITGGMRDITIANGHIRGGVTNNGSGVFNGPGFNGGIDISSGTVENVLISKLTVSGCLTRGISLSLGSPESSVVDSCVVRTVGGRGIVAATVKNSTATDCGSGGISAIQVSDSCGRSIFGVGISALSVMNSYGSSDNDDFGIQASTALNCYGWCASGSAQGIDTTTALNCYGAGDLGPGIAAYVAQNCYGISTAGGGISTLTAQNCWGESSSGTGLFAEVANTCVGTGGGGTAIQATIGIGCRALTGTNNITYKYNMP